LKKGLLFVLFVLAFIGVYAAPNLKTTALEQSTPPVAKNDTFIHIAKNRLTLTGNVLLNDYDPNGDRIQIYFAESPKEAYLQMDDDGNFSLELPKLYSGKIQFEYYIKEVTEAEYIALAHVYIEIIENSDLDEVEDKVDLDNDNDGLPDSAEGFHLDSDNDGIPNHFDIDSDNDGITDNIEWQDEHNYIPPSGIDANNNGWDDAYDPEMGGIYYRPVDTDENGVPDMLDRDSDADGRSDLTEAFDFNEDGRPDIQLLFSDADNDGLDDAFDCVFKGNDLTNPIASSCILGDLNQNGIRDWRDFTSHFTAQEGYAYPNPVLHSFQLYHPKLTYKQQINIQIFNMKGQLQMVHQTSHGNDLVPTSKLQNGTYILKATSDVFSHTQKLVIQH